MVKPKAILTRDGSTTLLDPCTGSTYHSIHGALTESKLIYITYGLNHMAKLQDDQIHILELGFGTGINAWLSWITSEEKQFHIHYTTVDKFPLEEDVWNDLPYCNPTLYLGSQKFHAIHSVPWNQNVQLDDHFGLKKIYADWQNYQQLAGSMDVVFYDAFGPGSQSELWSQASLQKSYDALKEGGIWLSYCAQGEVKRKLRNIGFQLEPLPGPPGKREVTRAIKTAKNIL